MSVKYNELKKNWEARASKRLIWPRKSGHAVMQRLVV